jgi:hypothetical protein
LKALTAGCADSDSDEPGARPLWNGGTAALWLVHEERCERTVASVSEALHAALEPYVTPRWPAAGILGVAGHRDQAMAVKRAVIAAIMGPFGHPRGAAGRVAGWVMTHRRSNRQRNSWVVSLLEAQPTENVLKNGFGPGLAIAELSRRAGEQGHVYGIDHSDVMLRQATDPDPRFWTRPWFASSPSTQTPIAATARQRQTHILRAGAAQEDTPACDRSSVPEQ